MDHCLITVNSDNESYTFNCDAGIKQEPNDPPDMEIDTEKHEQSGLWLEIGKTKDMETVISTTDNSVGKVRSGNSCSEQMTIKSDEFRDQVIRVDKQRQYNDYAEREDGTYDCYIKKECTYDIKMGSEEDRLNCTWLEVGKYEDFDQETVNPNDSSNKPVLDDYHKEHKVTEVEKYENDIKEENVEDLLIDIKSFSEDLSTEFICKDDPESSSVQWFSCDLCEYKAKYKKTLWTHFRRKHNANAGWHNCQFCEYKTKIQSYLKQHLKRKHEMSVDLYQCQLCHLKTKSKRNLKNHLKVMHDMNIIWHHCQHCKFKTKYKYSFDAHLAYKHKIIDEKCKLQQCQFCDYITIRAFSLRQHLKRKHDQKAVWQHCQYCKFKTKYAYSLEAHLENHSQNAELHQCRQCLFKTEDEDTLARHVTCKHKSPNESKDSENCKPYKCRLCKFRTNKQHFLTRHFTNVHQKNTELYKCLLCDFKTEDKFRHTLHFKKNHPVYTYSMKPHIIMKRKNDQKKWHQCQHCRFKTKNEDILARHIICKHESPNESKNTENCELYQCMLCKFETNKQCALTRHFTNVHHKNTELYKCILCDFKTEDKLGLTLHFKKNHPVSAN